MTAHDVARDVLARLQAGADAMTVDALGSVFDTAEDVVLIGGTAHRLGLAGVREYLTLLVEAGSRLRWEWDQVHVFLDTPGAVGFACFGEVVLSDDGEETKAPIRMTAVAVPTPDGWRLRQFHGSLPSEW